MIASEMVDERLYFGGKEKSGGVLKDARVWTWIAAMMSRLTFSGSDAWRKE